MLTHYTDRMEKIIGILTNGFAWLPNRRNLMPQLVPEHDFSRREPQEFGMVSFTELEPKDSGDHTLGFGRFGIVVSKAWARANHAERVIYVENSGPSFEAWRSLFEAGYRDLKSRIRFPDDGAWRMSFENKAMAGAVAGAQLWPSLLQLYEYMESAEYSGEREWRIVHPHPYYSLAKSVDEAIQQVSPPQGWAQELDVLTVSPQDVSALICPQSECSSLRDQLPLEYKETTVFHTNG